MINTVTEYRAWAKGLRSEMVAISDTIPRSKRNDVITEVAAELNLSGTTIINYLNGMGTDPETALSIKETIQTILSENKNQ